MSAQETLYDVINPIGSIVVIVFNFALAIILTRSFRETKAKTSAKKVTTLQILSIVICLWYNLYLFAIIINRWVVDITNCPIRLLLSGTLYVISRGILYYFFFVRLVAAFTGSAFATNPSTVKCVRVFMVVFYFLWALMFVITMNMNEFDEERQVCMPTSSVVYIFAFCGAIIDFFLGVYICGAFAYKLKKLQDSIDTIDDMNEKKKVNFVNVAKQQIKLSFVAWITTMIFTYVKSALGPLSGPWIDVLVNVLCVYCSFSFAGAQKAWRYLCECDGNKWCLLLFCFCCTCCNAPGCWCCAKNKGAASFRADSEKVQSTDNDAMSSSADNNASSAVDIVSVDTTADKTVDETATNTITDAITTTVPSNTATI